MATHCGASDPGVVHEINGYSVEVFESGGRWYWSRCGKLGAGLPFKWRGPYRRASAALAHAIDHYNRK